MFVWSLRRHRYETAHIERKLKGFFPVLTHAVAPPKGRGGAKVPGFSILVEKQDGLRYRRSYAFFDNLVRFSGEERVDNRPEQIAPEVSPQQAAASQPEAAQQAADSLYGRVKRRLYELGKRFLGL